MRIQIGKYMVQVWMKRVPPHFASLLDLSDLSETFDDIQHNGQEDDAFCVSVSPQFQMWPALFVAQRFSAQDIPGFASGMLVVPETGLALIGAGERLLAYDLNKAERLWEDAADFGFWWWDRQGEIILMAAECELAAWNLHGQKLWSTWAEPPWSYSVQNRMIQLDVMNNLSTFPLASGPTQETP